MADLVRQTLVEHWLTFSVLLILVSWNHIRRMLKKRKSKLQEMGFRPFSCDRCIYPGCSDAAIYPLVDTIPVPYMKGMLLEKGNFDFQGGGVALGIRPMNGSLSFLLEELLHGIGDHPALQGEGADRCRGGGAEGGIVKEEEDVILLPLFNRKLS